MEAEPWSVVWQVEHSSSDHTSLLCGAYSAYRNSVFLLSSPQPSLEKGSVG